MGTEKITNLEKIYIDTSIYIYTLQKHARFFNKCNEIFKTLEANSTSILISTILFTEVLQHKDIQENIDVKFQLKHDLLTIPNSSISKVNLNVAEYAAEISYKYNLTLPDAIHLSTAILNQCEAFITNDKKLKRVEEISVYTLSDF